MISIGINEGINSSVVVGDSGRLLLAIQEERLNRKKEFTGFPDQALRFALDYLNLSSSDIENVHFSNSSNLPIRSREEYLEFYRSKALRSFHGIRARETTASFLSSSFIKARRGVLEKNNSNRKSNFLRTYNLQDKMIDKYSHHELHAISAYYGCRSSEDVPHLVFTLDGGGDDLCASIWIMSRNERKLLAKTPAGNSIGNIWSVITCMYGMRPHEHEYKVMGLAPYSDEVYAQEAYEVFRRILAIDESGLKFQRKIPERTAYAGPRLAKELYLKRFDSIAGGLQKYTEDLVCEWISNAVKQTKIKHVVAAGGVFMNVKMNKAIADRIDVQHFDVFPSCGDETLPIGSVWGLWADSATNKGDDIKLSNFYLGPDLKVSHSDLNLIATQYKVTEYEDINGKLAELIAQGEVVARCAGRMEFGARALGNRSIIADPSQRNVVTKINKMIKMRDFWMPFAPSVLAEDVQDYFRVPSSLSNGSYYMMHSFDSIGDIERVSGGVHQYDNSARAQFVSRSSNEGYWSLLDKFKKITNRAVVLNTSFNLHGLPLVNNVDDALLVFKESGLEYLALNNYLVQKSN